MTKYWAGFSDWATGDTELSALEILRLRSVFQDTIACMAAGFATPAYDVALALPERVFQWACAAHALDYDDYDVPTVGHPSVVILPAVLATAHNATLGDLFLAYRAGHEAMARAGDMVNPEHYETGWHATAVLGVIGAAAAAARLKGANAAQMLTAISLAAGFTGASKAQFGTMAKPLNIGFAARQGVDVATLAMAGACANPEALSLKWFARMFGTKPRWPETPAGNPSALEQQGLIAKAYPCCGYLARPVEMCIKARASGIDPTQIAAVTLSLPPRNGAIVGEPYPTTGDGARFSAVYCAAVALIRGCVTLGDFETAAFADTAVQSLAAKTTLHILPENLSPSDLSPDDPDHLEIRMTNGKTHRFTQGVLKGSPANPLTFEEQYAKFHDCLVYAGLDPSLGGPILKLCNTAALETPAGPLIDALTRLQK
jgi:2-methylcitrate dehydratase PrpD